MADTGDGDKKTEDTSNESLSESVVMVAKVVVADSGDGNGGPLQDTNKQTENINSESVSESIVMVTEVGDGDKSQLLDTDKHTNINTESVSGSVVMVTKEDFDGGSPNIHSEEEILEELSIEDENVGGDAIEVLGSDPEKQSGEEEYEDDFEDDSGGDETDVEDNDDMSSTLSMAIHPRLANPDLPPTVTVLDTTWGSKVYVVGTAHFSEESQNDVTKTIEATQPDVVLVELCSSRINILQYDENRLLEEASNIDFEKIKCSIKQNGLSQGIMHLLFLSMSAHLTKQLGMAPGGEFRRAFRDAKRIEGCRIQLGDRPIQITLQRALASLSIWQKLKLVWTLITCKDPISKEDIERCKQKDLLEEMLQEMTGEYPGLSRVFVDERDAFLTHSLRHAAQPWSPPNKDNVYVPAVVVGVVGMGHVAGIKANWEKPQYNIRDIMQVPPEGFLSKAIRLTFRLSLLGIMTAACYKFYRWIVPFFI